MKRLIHRGSEEVRQINHRDKFSKESLMMNNLK